MTESIRAMRDFIRSGGHHQHRREAPFPPAQRFAKDQLPDIVRVTRAFKDMLAAETPCVYPGERILFWRTVTNLPQIFTTHEWEKISAAHFIHEQGRVCNISPNYARTLKIGLLAQRGQAEDGHSSAQTDEQKRFYQCAIDSIDAILDLTARYRAAALAAGNAEAAAILSRVPAQGATSFHEALQSLRIIQYALWCEGEYHNTLGRFDQYMWPYLKADLESGRLTEMAALELVEEFFLSLNRDSDLYPGIQQGDNGQSIMLGGVDRDGRPAFNPLSSLCLTASRELLLIDPKINLRASKDTPLDVFEQGTLLTREGLGFPQYSNDDVVIPALVSKGYALEDARDYTVAACWEFIIPGVGMDIPNIGAVNFPALVNDAVMEDMLGCATYDDFFRAVSARLGETCAELLATTRNLYMMPAPYMSVMMDGCLENGRDISLGAKYNNYGFHGVGLATAVDSLYTIEKLIYHERSLAKSAAQRILREGFEGREALLARIKFELPKFGDDQDDVDRIAKALVDAFGAAVSDLRNERGGCVRAGTGSAMFYLWFAAHVGTSLSGHQKGEAFGANYAPELFVRNAGPLSVIRSFTKPDLLQVCNGGPLTMEFHQSVFKDDAAIRKVAALVQAFIRSGGHQMQLNSVNRDTLIDAKAHPDQHKNLIVRIWGWSAYFVELDEEYQDHVIARQEFVV